MAELQARSADSKVLSYQAVDEDLRLLRLGVGYEDGVIFGVRRRAMAAVTIGTDGFGASLKSNPLASRPGARSEFSRASAALEASIPLSALFVVNVGVIGQWTDDPLPLSQQCGFGANGYSRGFDRSYVTGDRCVGSRTELALNLTPPSASTSTFLQSYAGIDLGWWQNVGIDAMDDTWSSISLGMRVLRGGFVGEVSLTRVRDKPQGVAPQDDTRLWLRGAVRF